MPLREFACRSCGAYTEVFSWKINPDEVPEPACEMCNQNMAILISVPKVDTADSFHPFDYRGPDGKRWKVDNLHKLRAIEHTYAQTGHNVRFDAYSADPNNPDTVDGMGMPYRKGDGSDTAKNVYSFAKA